MWTELRDKKQTAGNFLSLYEDSAFPDTRPPPQGLFPTTRDFLQPLERTEKSAACGQRGAAARGGASAGKHGPAERPPPGSFGTHGADHVRRPAAAVKPELPTCAPPEIAERTAEPRRPAFSLWEEEPAAWARQGGGGGGVAEQATGTHHEQLPLRWPPQLPFPAAVGGTNGSLLRSFAPAGEQTAKDGGSPMVATAVSGVDCFADDADEGEEEKPYLREITVKIADGSTDSKDTLVDKEQKPSTPRSKHSATEQRRRMKINDRFQMLRGLIPNSDQKRDKASFLSEVIEYIQCLQEKVQKYESSHPGRNPVDSKLMPWNGCRATGQSIVDHSGIIRQHHTSTRFMFPAESDILNSPTVVSNNQNVPEPDNQGALTRKTASIPIHMQFSIGHGGGFPQHHVKLVSDSLSVGVPPQSQWLRSSAMDAGINTDVLSGHEELTISKGTESLSSLYSKRLMSTLKQALQHSGVDDSEASISVHINVRRQSTSHISSLKNHDDPVSSNHTVHSSMEHSGDEPAPASKRHKSVTGS